MARDYIGVDDKPSLIEMDGEPVSVEAEDESEQ